MKDELVFNGKNLNEFAAYLSTSNFLDGANREFESVSVPGRSGDLLINKKRFSNLSMQVQMYIVENFLENAAALRDFMISSVGYCKLEDTMNADSYRMACFKSVFAPKEFDRESGIVDLVFDCKPQRWLRSGDDPIECAAGESVTVRNPTPFPATPIVKVTGTGTFVVGGVLFTLSTNTSIVTVDFERGDAYEESGLINRNGALTLSADEFPDIPTGESAISATGCSIEVYPRWYRL